MPEKCRVIVTFRLPLALRVRFVARSRAVVVGAAASRQRLRRENGKTSGKRRRGGSRGKKGGGRCVGKGGAFGRGGWLRNPA